MHIVTQRHRPAADAEPDLVASDIPFSATGLSRTVVIDVADIDVGTWRMMALEALALAARLTVRCRQYELVVAQLREALRARRAA